MMNPNLASQWGLAEAQIPTVHMFDEDNISMMRNLYKFQVTYLRKFFYRSLFFTYCIVLMYGVPTGLIGLIVVFGERAIPSSLFSYTIINFATAAVIITILCIIIVYGSDNNDVDIEMKKQLINWTMLIQGQMK